LGSGITRPEPAPTTHGGYGRNKTGGWLADDPRVVPLRPRACGGSGAGFGVQKPGINPAGGAMPRVHGVLGHRAGERGLDQPPSGGCKSKDVTNHPVCSKIIGSSFNICWLLHMRDRPIWAYEMRASDGLGYWQ
jgi:hypothetical protein